MPEVTRERPPMIIGVDDSMSAIENDLVFDSNDLSLGGLALANVTIMGVSYRPGGDTRTRDNGNGKGPESYQTADQMLLSLRVDDWEELGVETNEATQYLSMPKSINVNGQVRRAKLTRQSTYGLFLIHLEELGVSSNPARAVEVLIDAGPKDLIGLRFRRELRQIEGQINGQARAPIHLPTELYGYDNDVRAQAGLEPKYTNSELQAQRPAPETVAAAAVPSRRQPAAANA